MPFPKGVSGNPGGKRKPVGLSRAVRESEGKKSWAWLCKAGEGQVLERKVIKGPSGDDIEVDVVPSVKTLFEIHKLKLSYCWGTPEKMDSEFEQRIADLERRFMRLDESHHGNGLRTPN